MAQHNDAQDDGPLSVPLLHGEVRGPDFQHYLTANVREPYQSSMYDATGTDLEMRLLKMTVGANHRRLTCKSSQLRQILHQMALHLLKRLETLEVLPVH